MRFGGGEHRARRGPGQRPAGPAPGDLDTPRHRGGLHRSERAELPASPERVTDIGHRPFDAGLVARFAGPRRVDQNLVRELPGLIEKLDSTLARLDSAAGNADGILSENRAAINSFANDGLAQLGPTLTELRGLIRDLRQISDRLENNPSRYLLGRDAPKEYDPQ